MKTIVSKIGVAVCFGTVFVLFSHFDLLRHIPGFYCEGFGCLGRGFAYLVIGLVIVPFVLMVVSLATAKTNRIRHAAESLVISLLVMVVSIYAVRALNDMQNARATQKGQADERQFHAQIARRAVVKMDAKTLCIEQVDAARNNSGRGVFQATLVPDELSVNTPAIVTVSAEIGSAGDIESVMLHAAPGVIGASVLMYDNGQNGDLRANDTVFTAQAEIRIVTPGQVAFEIEVLYADGYKAKSRALKLQVYE